MHGQKQPSPHCTLKDFPVRIIVAGSRGYDDYWFFSEVVRDYLTQFSEPVIFISGAARSGADALIIRWCQEHDYPWVEFPADWDNVSDPGSVVRYRCDGKPYNVKAGFARNEEMARVGTNLMAWWDGVSSGTASMCSLATKHGLKTETFLISVDRKR